MAEADDGLVDSCCSYIDKLVINRKKMQTKGPAHDLGAGAPCIRCGDACPGLELHFWRKICKNCQCKRDDHEIESEDLASHPVGRLLDNHPIYGKLHASQGTDAPEDGGHDSGLEEDLYEWLPRGTAKKLVKRYMDMLPPERQPMKGSSGAEYRKTQLKLQLPVYDLDPELCSNANQSETASHQEVVEKKHKMSVGVGEVLESPEGANWVCVECSEAVQTGDVAVFARRVGMNVCWHPNCFMCSKCRQLLVDMVYFYRHGVIYCGRHYGDTVRPRCASCDELIFAHEYTQAENQTWHTHHFCCEICDQALAGEQYIPHDGRPYCMSCYQTRFGKTCCSCEKPIPVQAQCVTYGGHSWHLQPECFQCAACQLNLIGARFIPLDARLFCSPACKRAYLEK